MKGLFVSLLAASLCLVSCGTNKGLLDCKDAMYSMIYDYDSLPIPGVKVSVDGKVCGESDIQGRFVFVGLKPNEHIVAFEKDGYEKKECTVRFDPAAALYVKMGNAEQYRRMTGDALDAGNLERALALCSRALEIDPSRNDVLYMLAVIHSLRGEMKESNAALDRIARTKESAAYIDALRERNDAEDR